ncbi:hypothetical protein [Streptomyces alanosinicus]|uniref:ATP-grasp domain-containing protein n=1 Tax=Streptomyces alanosinicus TaxID=68171 RepID=A0A919D968_9ACTN|nr:hypothetical protein [Streptomyces alanosinicus]GHE14814.1 hypothetical protein GCM10010339_87430 [Streptomyces alanosinicus]
MRPLRVPDPALSEAAGRALAAALAGRPLVSAERFTSSMRTAYTGPGAIPVLRPVVAVGCYPAWPAAAAHTVLAAEERTRVRGPVQRHGWQDAVDNDARALLAGLPKPPVIAAWYATGRLRAWAGPSGTVAAVDGRLCRTVEDKASFDQLLKDAGVPDRVRIPCVRVDGRLPGLFELRRAVGADRLVVQAGADSGGRGTVFVDTDADLRRAAAMTGPYKVAAFVDGWSSNTTVLSVPDGAGGIAVYVDRPSHKAVGVSEAGIGPGKSVGNDWSRPWPGPAAADLVEAAVRIGEHLWRTRRMAGLFGLDALLTPDGRVLFNEINCRNQGSTEVSGTNQQLRGLPPFLAAHLTVVLGGRADWLPDVAEFNAGTIAAASPPGPGPFYLKLRHRGDAPARLTGLKGPGIYRLNGDRLVWLREGAHPAEADADADEVLLTALPDETTVCLPGAELGTAEGLTSGPGSPFAAPHDLSGLGRGVIDALSHQLVPVPVPAPSAFVR